MFHGFIRAFPDTCTGQKCLFPVMSRKICWTQSHRWEDHHWEWRDRYRKSLWL